MDPGFFADWEKSESLHDIVFEETKGVIEVIFFYWFLRISIEEVIFLPGLVVKAGCVLCVKEDKCWFFFPFTQ